MALSKLSGDEQGVIFVQLCNVLDPGIAVALSSVSNELRAATRVPLQQLKTDHKVAAALCRKLGHRNCKALREAKVVNWHSLGLTADELKLLGKLGSVLPALETLNLTEPAAGPDGGRQLAEGLGAGALPAVAALRIFEIDVCDAGASALAAALGQGALPRLKGLVLSHAAISDAGLVALAPALRRRPALEWLSLYNSPFGDEGLAALVAPPPPAGAPPTTTGGLTKLKELWLGYTQVTDAGCATLAAALESGALPALEGLYLEGIPASAAAKAAVYAARANLKGSRVYHARVAMALSALSGDEQGILFVQLCNVLDPGVAVALSSVSNELRTATLAPLQQLKTGHEAAAALCRKLGLQNCKALREAKRATWWNKGLAADELKLLGTLGSVLPALDQLWLIEPAAGPNGVQQLAEGLRAGALPAVAYLWIENTHIGDAGASALAAALGQGALPRLKSLCLRHAAFGDALATALGQGALPRLKDLTLYKAAIGDAGLVALAPALRRRPALEILVLGGNSFGDEGLAALVAPPPPAGAPPPPTGGLTKLKVLYLERTQITDAGCATLAAALDSGALPALEKLYLYDIPASAAAKAAVYAARANLEGGPSRE